MRASCLRLPAFATYLRLLATRGVDQWGGGPESDSDCPTTTSPVGRAAKQTKTNVDKKMGPRGPGANVMNESFRPHFARFSPSSRQRAVVGFATAADDTDVHRARGVSSIRPAEPDNERWTPQATGLRTRVPPQNQWHRLLEGRSPLTYLLT